MENIDGFYNKVFGKESALFIGTLWLGMIAKHIDEVRKAEDEAYELRGEYIYKWLNKLRTLYDNVEFKTFIPTYKDEIEFEHLKFDRNLQKYNLETTKILRKRKFLYWFEKIKLLIEISWKIGNDEHNKKNKI